MTRMAERPERPGVGAIVVGVFAVLVSAFLFWPESEAPVQTAASSKPSSLFKEKITEGGDQPPIDPTMWWKPGTQEELEAELLTELEESEATLRSELAAEPEEERWKVQAKLALSLLETNSSRMRPRPDRYEEGKALAEAVLAAQPDAWQAKLTKVALLLADFNNTKTEEASRLAQDIVELESNPVTLKEMGRAYLVDGCALMCRYRAQRHRIALDPEGAIYPEGKAPKQLAESFVHTAMKRLVEAGKQLHSSYDKCARAAGDARRARGRRGG